MTCKITTFIVVMTVKYYNGHLVGLRVKSINTCKFIAFSFLSTCVDLHCSTPPWFCWPIHPAAPQGPWEMNSIRGRILPGSVLQSVVFVPVLA